MERKDFLKTGLLGGATVIPTASAFSQTMTDNPIDKLADKDGNFVHQPLTYTNNHLEPYMDNSVYSYLWNKFSSSRTDWRWL